MRFPIVCFLFALKFSYITNFFFISFDTDLAMEPSWPHPQNHPNYQDYMHILSC